MIKCLCFYSYIVISIATHLSLVAVGHAGLSVPEIPSFVLRDGLSALDRPEGIAFTPSENYLAIANSSGNTITFYKRIEGERSTYEMLPAFSIQGEESKLDFPHDLSFSPDGNSLAVANRYGNSVTIYKKADDGEYYDNIPKVVIAGKSSGVERPNSVKYSPMGNCLAVANSKGNSITFYHCAGDDYDVVPFQTLKDKTDRVSNPNSIDFSADGELLAVASVDTHSVLIYKRSRRSGRMFSSTPVEILKGDESGLCYPHSVCFHPVSKHLAVTNAQGRSNVNIFRRVSNDAPFYSPKPALCLTVTEMYEESTLHLIDELQGRGGCKGVAFSPSGTSIAVTQNLGVENLELTHPLGVLLIYPFPIFD